MIRNYLKGTHGDAINLMMAAAAMNFKRMMNKWAKQITFFVRQIIDLIMQYNYLMLNLSFKKTLFEGRLINKLIIINTNIMGV